MSYKIQYVSNLFLDLHKHNFRKLLVPTQPNLALLGNIASSPKVSNEFLHYVSHNWEHIYYVPGPWEHTSNKQDYRITLDKLSERVHKFNNILLLNNTTIDIPNTDISLCGTTYWPQYPYARNPTYYEFSKIHVAGHSGLRQLLGYDIEVWHLEDNEYLRESLKRNYRRYIVLSHYHPSLCLSDSSAHMRMQSSNSEDLLISPIHIWLSGASNKSTTGCIGVCNDVFVGINSYSSYITDFKYNNKYKADAYASLRGITVDLY